MTEHASEEGNGWAGWLPPGCLLVGIGLVATPIVGAITVGPSNAYAAAALVLAGLGAAAIACGIAAFLVVRRVVPPIVALVAGVAGAVPMILPATGSIGDGLDLALPTAYGTVLAVVCAVVERSRAAVAFLILWLLVGGTVGLAALASG